MKTRTDVKQQAAAADAYSIDEFCARHGHISRAHFYNLRKEKIGPREMKLGSRVLISREAAAEWRREREAAGRAPQRNRTHGE